MQVYLKVTLKLYFVQLDFLNLLFITVDFITLEWDSCVKI